MRHFEIVWFGTPAHSEITHREQNRSSFRYHLIYGCYCVFI